jgi:hypothetical protein
MAEEVADAGIRVQGVTAADHDALGQRPSPSNGDRNCPGRLNYWRAILTPVPAPKQGGR